MTEERPDTPYERPRIVQPRIVPGTGLDGELGVREDVGAAAGELRPWTSVELTGEDEDRGGAAG